MASVARRMAVATYICWGGPAARWCCRGRDRCRGRHAVTAHALRCAGAGVYKRVRAWPVEVKSLFILWITVPRSSVRPSLTRAWWLSATGYVAALEPPPGRGGRQWLGSLPRHSAGVGIPKSHCQVTRSTAILAHSIPSPSSHGSAMARTGRKSLIHTKSNRSRSSPCLSSGLPVLVPLSDPR